MILRRFLTPSSTLPALFFLLHYHEGWDVFGTMVIVQHGNNFKAIEPEQVLSKCFIHIILYEYNYFACIDYEVKKMVACHLVVVGTPSHYGSTYHSSTYQ